MHENSHRNPQPHEALRRAERGRQRRSRRACRRRLRLPRPERRRQDDHDPNAARAHGADARARSSCSACPHPDRRAAALARVGAIVEEPRFHPFLSGRENLRDRRCRAQPEAHGRIDAALARVGPRRPCRRPRRRRTRSACASGSASPAPCSPTLQLLILDEPMNGLDPAGILEIRAMVIRSFVDEGRTVFLSSHLLDEVEKTATRSPSSTAAASSCRARSPRSSAAAATRP